MSNSSHPVVCFRSFTMFRATLLALVIGLFAPALCAQLIYQESFETDGAGTRYTVEGKGFVADSGAGGPAFWTHNFEVTKAGKVVGIPAVSPARRAIFLWNHGLNPAAVTPDAFKLVDATINWLLNGKKSAKILFSPPAVGDGDIALVERLTAAGHTVTDDDTGSPVPAVTAVDLVIQSSSGVPTPTRFNGYGAPLLSFNASNHDDELTSSIGSTSTFNPGDVTIKAPTHAAATGLPAKFKYVTEDQPLDLIGNTLPEGSTILATYMADNPNAPGTQIELPLVLLIEKGGSLLGGLISGQEGTGFFAGADMNEPTIADGAFATEAEPRSLTLKSVNVAGKTNVKLTLAIAGTDVDFETSDFLKVLVDTDGAGPGGFTTLADFRPPSGNDKFFTDGKTRVGIRFKDVTYDVPAGATDLIVRIESMSTFFNEIVAFDNIRITAGTTVTAPTISIKRDGNNISLEFTGTLQTAASVTGPWTDVANAKSPFVIERASLAKMQFLRVRN
jgi:hypothetical protein